MSALTRRDAIAAGTAVVAGGFAGVAAAVEPTHADPALEAIETRMTAVENRGTTLNRATRQGRPQSGGNPR